MEGIQRDTNVASLESPMEEGEDGDEQSSNGK